MQMCSAEHDGKNKLKTKNPQRGDGQDADSAWQRPARLDGTLHGWPWGSSSGLCSRGGSAVFLFDPFILFSPPFPNFIFFFTRPVLATLL